MAKTSYQTFTQETPLDIYRTDFLRRGALCKALADRYAALDAIGTEATAIVGQIDERRAALQLAEDDQVRARAIEDAKKLDVVEVYTELRRTLFAKKIDVITLLPEAPSTLGRLGIKTFNERIAAAIGNLKTLPDGHPQKTAFLPSLEQEFAELSAADVVEDATRATEKSIGVALTLYKAELSMARVSQLGAIQNVLRDREKTALFTIAWRKPSKRRVEDEEGENEAGDETPTADPTSEPPPA